MEPNAPQCRRRWWQSPSDELARVPDTAASRHALEPENRVNGPVDQPAGGEAQEQAAGDQAAETKPEP